MSDPHGQITATTSTHAVSEPAAHGHDQSHAGHDMHLKLYWGIGGVLIFLTGVTVALSYIDFGSRESNMVIGMLLATFKVGLVGAIFMHLKGERATIWRFLFFTAFFVAGLFLLTYFSWVDPIFQTETNKH